MKIRVEKIETTPLSAILVSFHCSAGNGKGLWAKWAQQPTVGGSYSAEIDINEILQLGTNTSITHDSQPSISASTINTVSVNKLTLSIESIDDDGLICARLAPDCLLLLVQDDKQLTSGQTISLTIAATDIQISPFGQA